MDELKKKLDDKLSELDKIIDEKIHGGNMKNTKGGIPIESLYGNISRRTAGLYAAEILKRGIPYLYLDDFSRFKQGRFIGRIKKALKTKARELWTRIKKLK